MGKKLQKQSSGSIQKRKNENSLVSLENIHQALSKFVYSKELKDNKIPNAALIYGIASAALFAFALYHLIVGQGLFAILLSVLGVVMFAYAVFFIKSSNKRI